LLRLFLNCIIRRVLKRAPLVYLMLAAGLSAEQEPGTWTGNYSPCDRHGEVLKRDAMTLGVRFSTSSHELAVEFARALDFWATVLDMNWYTENSRQCAIQVVDGHSELFKPAQVARAQFPAARSFQGWIAFNPEASLSATDLFLTAVHELGHMLGMPHSANASSVMYFLRLDTKVFLDAGDLATLAAHHKLRAFTTPARLLPVAMRRPRFQ
jgi:hypothetical protein